MLTCLPDSVDAGRRQETPASGAKDIIKTHSNSSSQSISMFFPSFLSPQLPYGDRMPGDTCTLWTVIQENNYELMEHEPFIMNSKTMPIHLLQRSTLSSFYWQVQLTLAMQGDSISSSKAVNNPFLCSSVRHYLPIHSTNNLENILWNKYSQSVPLLARHAEIHRYLSYNNTKFAKPLPH